MSRVSDTLKIWLNGFSREHVVIFGGVVASLFVLTANIFAWIVSNPPFVQTNANFSEPTSLSFLGNWAYLGLLFLTGFAITRTIVVSEKLWLRTFVKRFSRLSTVRLFVVIIYGPVAIDLIIQYSLSMITGEPFSSLDLIGGLLSWTVSFSIFTGLAYVIGNLFRRRN